MKHWAKKTADYISEVSPVLDLAAIAFGGVPIIGEALIFAAVTADVVSAIDGGINAKEEISAHGLDWTAGLDIVGAVASAAGVGGFAYMKLADSQARTALNASKATEKHVNEYPRSFKRQNAHAAVVAQMNAKTNTAGAALAVSSASGLVSDTNTLFCDGGLTCQSSFNPLHP